MRIGIDIDDTITNSWEYLKPIYEKEFNIELNINSLPYYKAVKEKINLTFDEFASRLNKYDQLKMDIPIKKDAIEVLNKLKQEGYTIVFITARGKTYKNPYQLTIEYLNKFNIPYDKIILESWDKSISCKEEEIDLFIDDSPKHCEEVSNVGIDVLMMETTYNKKYSQFKRIKNWYQVYDYIKVYECIKKR